MKIPKGATVAVADGEKLGLFSNAGEEREPKLVALPEAELVITNAGSGGRHQSSSANPADSQQEEDSFASGIAKMLNERALEGRIKQLIIVAAPRTLGELRKHYHQKLSDLIVGEIPKDLTGHSISDIEKIITGA